MGNTCSAPGTNGFKCNYSIKGFPAYYSIEDFSTNSSSNSNSSSSHNATTVSPGLTELDKIKADPDIAGIGVFVAVMIGFWFSTFVAVIVHAFEGREIRGLKNNAFTLGRKTKRFLYILDKNLVSWSDQQIVLGLATGVAMIVLWCDFSTYHFNLAKQWLVFCTITHVNALLVHCDYFNPKNWAANGVRGLFYVSHLVLSAVVVTGNGQDASAWAPTIGDRTPLQMLPAPCFFTNATRPRGFEKVDGWNGAGASSSGIFAAALALIILGLLSVVVGWFRRDKPRGWWSWGIRGVLLLANTVLGIYALQVTEKTRAWMIEGFLEDDSDDKLSYGQFVPMLLGFFVFFTFLESICDDLPEKKSDRSSKAYIDTDIQLENRLL